MGIITVLWEKWVEFRRDFYKITMAAMISPLMYLLIFGFGIQTTSHGEPYLMFLIPGIVAMSTMTGSFGAVARPRSGSSSPGRSWAVPSAACMRALSYCSSPFRCRMD